MKRVAILALTWTAACGATHDSADAEVADAIVEDAAVEDAAVDDASTDASLPECEGDDYGYAVGSFDGVPWSTGCVNVYVQAFDRNPGGPEFSLDLVSEPGLPLQRVSMPGFCGAQLELYLSSRLTGNGVIGGGPFGRAFFDATYPVEDTCAEDLTTTSGTWEVVEGNGWGHVVQVEARDIVFDMPDGHARRIDLMVLRFPTPSCPPADPVYVDASVADASVLSRKSCREPASRDDPSAA